MQLNLEDNNRWENSPKIWKWGNKIRMKAKCSNAWSHTAAWTRRGKVI